MLVIMLASGLGGVIFHYALLAGIEDGIVSKQPSLWSRCVAAPALLFAICASMVVKYFFEDVTFALALALWPVFILALHPAYRLTDRQENMQQAQEEHK